MIQGGIVNCGQRSPDRVVFRYPARKPGDTELREIPFVICAVANFSGMRAVVGRQSREARFVKVSPGSLNAVIKAMCPSIRLKPSPPVADASVTPQLIDLQFECLEDFEPQRIAARLGIWNTNLSGQSLDTILHDASFQCLHASWLGVERLVRASVSASVIVAIFDATQEEMLSKGKVGCVSETLIRAVEELNGYSSESSPPAALLFDFQFGPRDTPLLTALAKMAEAVHTVVVGAASPVFLPGNVFSNDVERNDRAYREMDLFAHWRAFQREDLSKYVFLTLPPVLLRTSYRGVNITPEKTSSPLLYNESTEPSIASGYLWGNGVYAIGCLLIAAFARYGWAAELSPLHSCAMTVQYSCQTYNDEFLPTTLGPTAVSLWQHSASVFSKLGFMPLVDCKGTPTVAVFDDHSCQRSIEPSAHMLYLTGLFSLSHALTLFARSGRIVELPNAELRDKFREWLSHYTTAASSTDKPLQLERRPLDAYNVEVYGDRNMRTVELVLTLNYGHGRRAPVTLEIDMPLPPAPGAYTPEGILESDIRAGQAPRWGRTRFIPSRKRGA